jgi:hypothetical protein
MISRRPGRARGQDERGSASLELAALVPIVVLLMLFVFQVLAVAYTTQAASQAARDAARAYSLGRSPTAAAEASLPGAVRLVGVTTFGPRHGVRVEVEAPPVQLIGDRRVIREVIMP